MFKDADDASVLVGLILRGVLNLTLEECEISDHALSRILMDLVDIDSRMLQTQKATIIVTKETDPSDVSAWTEIFAGLAQELCVVSTDRFPQSVMHRYH